MWESMKLSGETEKQTSRTEPCSIKNFKGTRGEDPIRKSEKEFPLFSSYFLCP